LLCQNQTKNMDSDLYLYKGINSQVYGYSRIIYPQNLLIDDYAVISDFCFILAGIYTKIGKYSRLAPYAMITGGGETYIHDYVDVSYGVKIISGSDAVYDGYLSLPNIAPELRNLKRQRVEIHKFSYIGINSIIFPGVTIGEGVLTEPNTVIKNNLEPWTIYGGSDCSIIGKRKKLTCFK
jgi:acetyltransferase-like isoleucine patch superfamily enzyme